MATVSKDLSAACGKPMAHWVSRYANQSGMEPVSPLIRTLPLGLDGETGYLPRGNEAPQHYTITVLEDKSVRIDVRCDWASMTSMTTADMDILELDKSSRIASSYSLLLTMPPSAAADAQPIVSILKPMELITDIRHSADQ